MANGVNHTSGSLNRHKKKRSSAAPTNHPHLSTTINGPTTRSIHNKPSRIPLFPLYRNPAPRISNSEMPAANERQDEALNAGGSRVHGVGGMDAEKARREIAETYSFAKIPSGDGSSGKRKPKEELRPVSPIREYIRPHANKPVIEEEVKPRYENPSESARQQSTLAICEYPHLKHVCIIEAVRRIQLEREERQVVKESKDSEDSEEDEHSEGSDEDEEDGFEFSALKGAA